MALTTSTMMALGTSAPAFELEDVTTGKVISLDFWENPQGVLIMFICCHCPFVKHVQTQLAQLGRDYGDRGIAIVAISANDVEKYPADAPDRLREMAQTLGFNFPVCFDESQAIAKAYTAACTPDFFLFDGDRHLVYRGQLDDSRPSNGISVTGKDLRTALDAVLAGQPVGSDQQPSVGCNIKWKPGNEPPYFGY